MAIKESYSIAKAFEEQQQQQYLGRGGGGAFKDESPVGIDNKCPWWELLNVFRIIETKIVILPAVHFLA